MNQSDILVAYLPGIVCLMFGLVLLLSGLLVGASEKRFRRESFETVGTIRKYWSEDYHSGDRPYIEFNCEGEKVTARAQTWLKDDGHQPPVGTNVRIRVRRSNALNADAWEVRVIGAKDNGSLLIGIGNGLAAVGAVLLVAAIILFVKGV